ncbi:hypothetical protein BVRB_4g076990 isoform A [Beta vulgaris subsp. vulgaris]|nr:hypothetical protein BVRB_4g076990 isoform A [Beta vulgaris subsp. vulgaris]
MVEDISCLMSNVDLRLALCTKRIFGALQDEEEQNIRDLISSAIFDPNVKGGLRWPLGKANSGGHYSVVGIWHTKTKAYSSSLYRLKLREADRYDFRTSTGEVTREAVVKLAGITRHLLEQRSDAVDVMAMLEDVLKLIRNQFLAWDGSLVSSDES